MSSVTRPDPVDAILAAHSIPGPWTELPTTGVANRIYATADVVLRIAGEHAESISDARTESVAAPAARAAGIRVPELIVFDDSRTLIDRPYSVWERVHAETLSAWKPEPSSARRTWRELGAELARLHELVRVCADPRSWLDDPSREGDPAGLLPGLVARQRIDVESAGRLERWLDHLRPALAEPVPLRFGHNDAHAGNVLCTADDELVALIDWGDAGWGDPAIELASVPVDAVPLVVSGYEEEGGQLGGDADARVLFDQIAMAIDATGNERQAGDALARLVAFVRSAPRRWRRLPW